MRRRVWVVAAAIAALVLFGGFGTARATQIIRGDQARSSALTERTVVEHSIAHAAANGVSTRIIGDWSRKATLLASKSPPAASILWDGATESFYQAEVQSYRRLLKRVQGHLTKVTRAARQQVATDLAAAHSLLLRAAVLDLDTSGASRNLSTLETQLHGAGVLRQFRTIDQSLLAIQSSLNVAIEARQKTVDGFLAADGKSVSAIGAQADADSNSANDQISLLSAFSSHTAAYSAAIIQLDNAVKSQTDPTRAAVKLADLETEISAINRQFQKTVPGQFILVSTEDQWAHVYQNGQLIYSTDVTTGGPELPTDHGIFHIYAKISPFVFHSPWPPGSPYYYLPSPVSYWMPFDGGEGLHDAPWRSNFGPGSNLAPTNLGDGNTILGTHGCVNLPSDAAQYIWNWASVGTTVVVI